MNNVIAAEYLIETPHSVERVAELIAGEQSSGTFVSIPGETAELKRRARARITRITPLESVGVASLPDSRGSNPMSSPASFRRAVIRVEFPFENVGANLPTLLATVCGNLFELKELS